MKKICYIVANIYRAGGVQRVVSILANELCELYDISIVSLFKTSDSIPFHLDSTIDVYNIFDDYFQSRISYFTSIPQINKYMSTIDADCYVVCGMSLVPFFWRSIARSKRRFLAWEHQNYTFGRFLGFDWIGKRIALRYSHSIIVLTQKDYNEYSRHRHNGSLYQIYNPTIIKECEQRKDHNIVPYVNILSVGSLISQKGFDYAIEIAKQIKGVNGDTSWHWDIYGDGPDKDKLQKRIEQYGLTNNVELKGYSRDIDSIYRNYSVFCMTSRHEGFPMVLLEASAHGLPIISFSCDTGPSEIIEDGINGYLVDPFNTTEFSEKVIKLINDKDLLCSMQWKNPKCKEMVELKYILNQWNELLGE